MVFEEIRCYSHSFDVIFKKSWYLNISTAEKLTMAGIKTHCKSQKLVISNANISCQCKANQKHEA